MASQAWGLTPSFGASPLMGRNPVTRLMVGLPWPGASTDPAQQLPFVLRSHCPQFSRLPAPGPKEDFQWDLSMGLWRNILSAGPEAPGLAWKGHKAGGGQRGFGTGPGHEWLL